MKYQSLLKQTGIRQGDGLACILFNLALEGAIRRSGVNTRDTILSKSTQLLAYADDIDIVSRSVEDLKESFIKIGRTAREIGLEINEEKTKTAHITSKIRVRRIGQSLTIGEYNFEVVNTFKYLGTKIDNIKTMSARKLKQSFIAASKCMYGLNKHLNSHLISRKIKIRIYRTFIKPVLTHARRGS